MRLKQLVVGLLLGYAVAALGATSCPQHFAGGEPPRIVNPKMQEGTTALCYAQFGVVHSTKTLTPLWSAEHLTKARIGAAEKLPRINSFHPEERLPVRAELADYARSGYDRGHMSPNHDMSNKTAQAESFSLANIVPQAPHINQGIWADIETGVRAEVLTGDDLYVITGPIFDGEEVQFLNGRVAIPTRVFKAVYSPSMKAAAAYVATNDKSTETRRYETWSIADLEASIGINLFPTVSDAIKGNKAHLPRPVAHAQ